MTETKNIDRAYKFYTLERFKEECEKKPQMGVKIGVNAIDEIFNIQCGYFGILQAPSGQGKSSFLNFIGSQMGLLHGWKTLYWSKEAEDFIQINELVKLYSVGNDKEKALKVMSEHTLMIDEEINTLDDLLACIEFAIKEHGVKLVILDNATNLESLMGYDITNEEKKELIEKLRDFAHKKEIAVLLAVHTTKLKQGEEQTANSGYGTVHYLNACDYMIGIKIENKGVTKISTLKIRYSWLGVLREERYIGYDPHTLKYFDLDEQPKDGVDFIFEEEERRKTAKKVMKKAVKFSDDNDEALDEIFGKVK